MTADTPAKATRWTAQWKELYEEVIETVLCAPDAQDALLRVHTMSSDTNMKKANTFLFISKKNLVSIIAFMEKKVALRAPVHALVSASGKNLQTCTCLDAHANQTKCQASGANCFSLAR